MEPIDYPYYEVQHGPRKGVHRFEYITAEEYRQLGLVRSKIVEWNRFRATMLSADPEAKAKWSKRAERGADIMSLDCGKEKWSRNAVGKRRVRRSAFRVSQG